MVPKESPADPEVFESVDEAAEPVVTGSPAGNGQVPRNLGADGRPLPEGKVTLRLRLHGSEGKYGPHGWCEVGVVGRGVCL